MALSGGGTIFETSKKTVRVRGVIFNLGFMGGSLGANVTVSRRSAQTPDWSGVHHKIDFPYGFRLIVIKTELAAHPVANHRLEGSGNVRHAIFDVYSYRA
jgi:hypothetical protein